MLSIEETNYTDSLGIVIVFLQSDFFTGAFLDAGIVIEVFALETPRGILTSTVYDASADMHVAKLDPIMRSLLEVPTPRTTHSDPDQNGSPEGVDHTLHLQTFADMQSLSVARGSLSLPGLGLGHPPR